MNVNCQFCGVLFEKRHHNQKYCGQECVRKTTNLRTLIWQRENPEKLRESNRKWYIKNKDSWNEYQKKANKKRYWRRKIEWESLSEEEKDAEMMLLWKKLRERKK